MGEDHRAFYAALAAICYLVTVAAVLAAFGRYTEAVGVGAAVTGIFSAMRPPAPRSVTIDQPADRPVPVEPAP